MQLPTKYSYYEILNISEHATLEEIKSAYRKLVKETHPDKTENSEVRKRFLLIQTAYETLTDEKKKMVYDEQLRESKPKNPIEEYSPSWTKWDLFWFFIWARIGGFMLGGFFGLVLFLFPYGCFKYPSAIRFADSYSSSPMTQSVDSYDAAVLWFSVSLWSILGAVLPWRIYREVFALGMICYPITAFLTIIIGRYIGPLIFY